ncbi:MAG: hypothetical protein U0525_03955 [Patescibacteria group bacterium]
MSTVIIGSGLSGILTAINIKNTSLEEDVLILDPNMNLSNTLIAGQRIRAGIAGQRTAPSDEIIELLTSRNDGIVTESMKIFTNVLLEEIEKWQKLGVPFVDDKLWFGPQWGNTELKGIAKSKSVLDYFKNKAESSHVKFTKLKITQLEIKNEKITSIIATDNKCEYEIFADNFVLAGGSSTGLLFDSTNREFELPPQLLASDAGLKLYDGTLTMIHPFGKCGNNNKPVAGCYETDLLTDIKLLNSSKDLQWIEDLLKDHKAHYQFPKICKELWRIGGILEFEKSNGERFKSCVSIHYNQLGIQTNDGVSVMGVENVFAVGDAAGVGYFTNHKVRFPGFALGNCLVTSNLAAKLISNRKNKGGINIRDIGSAKIRKKSDVIKKLKEINTKHVCAINLEDKTEIDICNKWIKELEMLSELKDATSVDKSTILLSIKMALAHREMIINKIVEPINI